MKFEIRKKRNLFINMTSLVDVVFLLLIFFMMSTNFIKHHGVEIDVPSPTGKKSSWTGSVLIRPNIETVLVNSTKVAINQVAEQLKKLGKINKVIVQPYKDVPLQVTVSVFDQIKSVGITSISLIK